MDSSSSSESSSDEAASVPRGRSAQSASAPVGETDGGTPEQAGLSSELTTAGGIFGECCESSVFDSSVTAMASPSPPRWSWSRGQSPSLASYGRMMSNMRGLGRSAKGFAQWMEAPGGCATTWLGYVQSFGPRARFDSCRPDNGPPECVDDYRLYFNVMRLTRNTQ